MKITKEMADTIRKIDSIRHTLAQLSNECALTRVQRTAPDNASRRLWDILEPYGGEALWEIIDYAQMEAKG